MYNLYVKIKPKTKFYIMKKTFILLLLVATTGTMVFGQATEKEMHLCVSDSIDLEMVMAGEWTGAGVVNNVFYAKGIPAGEAVKLICGKKEFLVYIQDIPYVSMGWTPKEIKVGSQPIQLSGYPTGGKWSLDGDIFDGNFYPNEVGVYEVIYMLTDEYGCTSGASQLINVK